MSSTGNSMSDDRWRRTATISQGTGTHNLGDTRDLFIPATGDIPANPGVYKWRDGNGRVIYVGKAKNLRNRLTNYFQPLNQLHPRTQNMVLTARSLEWTVVATELEALTLEYTWIKEFDPRFNVVFRDDKTYPYLAVSLGEKVPRVWVTRNRKRQDTRYFGPYAKVWPLRHSLDLLLKAYPVRTCTKNVFHRAQMTNRPCLLASIGKCSAPCVGRIDLKEHRRMCEQLAGALTGRYGKSYINDLTRQMKRASDDLEFEKAARLRDQIDMLNTVCEQNAVVLDSDVDADVFGLDSDELEASIHAFFVRSGSIRGERNWSVERVEDISDEDLLSDLIVQVYSELMEEPDNKAITPLNLPSNGEELLEANESAETDFSDVANVGAKSTDDSDDFQAVDDSITVPLPASVGGVSIRKRRDALGSTQALTATSALDRAQATRIRRERQMQTGRNDFLAPIAPVPREVLVPVEPSRRVELEQWLSGLRGSAVTIRVPSRGAKKDIMERAVSNAKQALQRSKLSRISDIGARTQAMNDVAKALGLSQAPLRIEGYDISNTIGGIYQVASMVVFEDAVAKKSEYRRFAIRGKGGKGQADDLSAVYETLARRFRHGNIAGDTGESIDNEKRIEQAARDGDMADSAKSTQAGVDGVAIVAPVTLPEQDDGVRSSPSTHMGVTATQSAGTKTFPTDRAGQSTDASIVQRVDDEVAAQVVQQNTQPRHFAYKPNLIVVDGGKPQVEAAARALADCGVDDVAVCGLAKRLEEVWLPGEDYPLILKRQSEGMYLLQRVRDESHRFAITYHRNTRRKGALRSALDDIPGIGDSYQKRLLRAFGSVKAIRAASIEDLQRVKGIGAAKAHSIYNALHPAADEKGSTD
ncbi:excinuclease ABC subunit C [Bifidobacterium bohemicum]|uniref:UvrABC system protein C n=2 Tax=Bifidobacterium bohemicum TaxID=638617 RepID=A0A086ZJK2_9BIFI|nr:excinuclease ABC subunit UvrC [Bifidobacterium bohemicum]KFI46702.1 excinuclease ABC subunit C [Bifidobacterium bohemicum DSM 22767]SCB79285.1 excinuclease ABC subunit C [Bifidobacterium bohemicum]